MIVDTAIDSELLEKDPFFRIKEDKMDGHIVNVDPDEDSPMV